MTALRLDARPLVIAEVAQTHDGSLGTAHAFVDAVAATGADAIKFQTHIAAAESRTDEPWRVAFSYEDATRYAYWQRMEFTEEGWAGLAAHARERGLAFVSSPFSIEACDLLERTGIDAWKIASGEVSNPVLLDRVAGTGLPVLVSSGMSPWAELDAAVERLRSAGAELAVLQCTSKYPTPPEEIGLNLVPEIGERYGCPSGISDHSGTIYPSLAAIALGASVVEVHVTLSREMFGPDVAVSLTTDELRTLVDGVRFLATARDAPVSKDEAAAGLGDMRALFTRSVVARRPLEEGAVLAAGDLTLKKPGGGLPADRLEGLLGRRLTRALDADEPLGEDDVA